MELKDFTKQFLKALKIDDVAELSDALWPRDWPLNRR